jgi:hypothetical protein
MPILTSYPPGNAPLFALDTKTPVPINLWESYLRGWFVPDTDANILGVMIEGSFVPAFYGLPRPDVARHLNKPNLLNCGFYVRFSGPKWNPLIKLVVQGKSRPFVLAELNVPLLSAKSHAAAQAVNSYEAWLNGREASLFWPENQVYNRLSALPYRPLLSVLLPTSNADPFLLDQCVESVLRQKYAHWQLCIVDSSSDADSVDRLRRLAASDDRIILAAGNPRAGVPEAQNLALKSAQGDFILMLDQNDELHPCALLEVVRLLNQRNSCEAIYSDEDKIDVYGSRSNPVFKADFDPDMLLASNYLGRLTALRRTTVLELGGFRSVCDGLEAQRARPCRETESGVRAASTCPFCASSLEAQRARPCRETESGIRAASTYPFCASSLEEWDLLVRLAEHAGAAAIQHIPKPLYHRRIQPAQPSPYVNVSAALRVISDHVARVDYPALVQTGLSPGSVRLKQQAPKTTKIAVFVLQEDGMFQIATVGMSMNRGREISLYQVRDCAIHAVDDASQSALVTLNDLSADVFIFINRPLESLNHLFFEELSAQALRADCGLAAGISVDVEKRILHSGFVHATESRLVDPFAGFEFSQVSHLDLLNVTRSVEMVSDQCFATRREHLAAVGGLSAISAVQMPQLVHKLATKAHRQRLRVIVTPFAVASFHQTRPNVPIDPVRPQDHNAVSLNPNLLMFEDLTQAMRGAF